MAPRHRVVIGETNNEIAFWSATKKNDDGSCCCVKTTLRCVFECRAGDYLEVARLAKKEKKQTRARSAVAADAAALDGDNDHGHDAEIQWV